MTNTEIIPTAETKTVKYNKRIGSTNYVVTVSFADSVNETMEEKILRLIKNEVQYSA
jgi:hypothetical protein